MPGPTTKNTATLALGLAQIRVGASAANIGTWMPALSESDSIGSLANTKFTGEKEFWKHSSGFPLLEDYVIPLRETAKLETAFEEITPYTLALANGIDVSAGGYTNAYSGVIGLGAAVAPEYIRMEAHYTFPNGVNSMDIVFPRAQVEGAMELDLQKEENAAPPIVFVAKRSNAATTGGNAVWDTKPLGNVVFRSGVA